MFIKHYLYCIKRLVKNRALFLWTLAFPFALGTLFFMAFGNLINDTAAFEAVPVAVVLDDSENAAYFEDFIDTLESSDQPVLSAAVADEKEAESLLDSGAVDGIITAQDTLSLTISQSGINQTILKNIVDIYQRKASILTAVQTENPQLVQQVAESFYEEIELSELSLGSTKANGDTQYFYALIAMTCLYGCLFGLQLSGQLQANLSALGIRRSCSPARKLPTILCDFLAALTIEFLIILLLLAYLTLIIKVDFGSNLLLTVLTSFMGLLFGIALGTFVGCTTVKSFEVKLGITMAISMLMCFFSGLMYSAMPHIIEKNVPLVNRLNPALLISNSFYCLTFYDNYRVYTRNMITLLMLSAILCLGSALLLRRKKYASL